MADISIDRLLLNARTGTKALIAAQEHLERLRKISKAVDSDDYRQKTEAAERIMRDAIDLTYNTIVTALSKLAELPFDERLVMMDYYIIGYDWGDIAQRRNYSERTVFNIRNRALKRLRRDE